MKGSLKLETITIGKKNIKLKKFHLNENESLTIVI